MAASSTRSLAVGQRLHHLKVFFSNRFVYAQVTRKTDGHVRAVRPPPVPFFASSSVRARTHHAILTRFLPSIPAMTDPRVREHDRARDARVPAEPER